MILGTSARVKRVDRGLKASKPWRVASAILRRATPSCACLHCSIDFTSNLIYVLLLQKHTTWAHWARCTGARRWQPVQQVQQSHRATRQSQVTRYLYLSDIVHEIGP